MNRFRCGIFLALVAVLTLPAGASAQKLKDIIPNLFDRASTFGGQGGITLDPGIHLTLGTDGIFVIDNIDHTNDFFGAGQTNKVLAIGDALHQSIATQISTFPTFGSPGGGFTYEYDSATGEYSRTGASLGNMFADRALTLGKGQRNWGFTLFRTEYDSIDGIDLGSSSLEFQLQHNDGGTPGIGPCTDRQIGFDRGAPITAADCERYWEGDLLGVTTSVDLWQETLIGFFSYGVTNRFDVGIAVPFVRNKMDAKLSMSIDRLSTIDQPLMHRFVDDNLRDPEGDEVLAGGSLIELVSEREEANGIGDVHLRAKYRFADAPEGGLAVSFDVALPTGDDQDYLGTGSARATAMLVGSRRWGAFSPYFNVGYTYSDNSGDTIRDLPDEINAGIGFDVQVHERVSLALGMRTRQLRGIDTFRQSDFIQEFTVSPSRNRAILEAIEEDPELAEEFGMQQCTQQNPCRTDFVDPNDDEEDIPDGVLREFLQKPRVDTAIVRDNVDLSLLTFGARFTPAKNFVVSTYFLFSLNSNGLEDEDPIPVVSLDYSF